MLLRRDCAERSRQVLRGALRGSDLRECRTRQVEAPVDEEPHVAEHLRGHRKQHLTAIVSAAAIRWPMLQSTIAAAGGWPHCDDAVEHLHTVDQVAVKNTWALLQKTGEAKFSFKGIDGKTYGNQFDTENCTVWLNETGDALHLELAGRYIFSKPPPFEGKGPVPRKLCRQMDWERGWHFQVEWFVLEFKTINAKLSE